MKPLQSSYATAIWVLIAALIVGLYTVDLQSDQVSLASLPDFSNTSTVDIEASENKFSPSLKDFNDAIVDIAENTKPTVVTVTVTQTVDRPRHPFSQFFGDPRGGEQEQFQRRGLGSGVIVSHDGYILTNNHVIENADEVEVELYNGKKITGEVVGTDPQTDIAVLKVDADDMDLDAIKLGSSEEARVGEMVLAIGSPLQPGLAHSVSMGIVSAKERNVGIFGEGGYESFIQTDAAINPGNSGGALINMEGDLIGINTAIASRSGGNEGIGFAVPIDIAKYAMESIIEHGRVVRGHLGIQMGGEVNAPMAKALDLKEDYGVIIGEVEEGSPAEQAGIQEEDIVHTINGKRVGSWDSFRTAIGTSAPGTEVELGISRDGGQETVAVTLGESPEDEPTDQSRRDNEDLEQQLGFEIQNLNPNIARQLELDADQEGVVVVQIDENSEAYQEGLRRGDVIIEMDRQPIGSTSDFNSVIQDIASDDGVVLLRVLRGGSSQLVAFEL